MPDLLKAPQFNGYSYQSTIDWPATFTDGKSMVLRTSQPPNVDGEYTAGGLFGARRPVIKGTLTVAATGVIQTDLLALRTAWDNFSAVHAPGQPARLFLDSDRYLNAEVASVSDTAWDGLLRRDYEVQFHCGDPFWYQASAYAPASNTDALTTSGAPAPTANTSNGLAAPTAPPALTAAAGSTALLAGDYTVAYTYVTAYGETYISPTATVTLTAGQQIDVSAITLPAGAASINLYLSIAANSTTLAYAATTNGAATNLTALPAQGTTTVTPGGSAYSLPVFSFVVTTAPVGGRITVINTSTGRTFTLLPNAVGTWTVDCTQDQEAVTMGGADVTSQFSGTFPRLPAAANVLQVGLAGGIVLSSASVTWQDRWY